MLETEGISRPSKIIGGSTGREGGEPNKSTKPKGNKKKCFVFF